MGLLRTLSALAAVGALIVGCGDDSPIVPKADVDMDAWRAELRQRPGTLANPDMDTLYDLAVDDCEAPESELRLALTLSGADPDLKRMGMRYACPSLAGRIDAALLEIQDTSDWFDQACQTPKRLRTEDQQQALEAVGTCPTL